MPTGPLSSVMLIAANGLLENQGINLPTSFTNAVANYNSTIPVAAYSNVVSGAISAGANITAPTLANIQTLGSSSLPSVTNVIPAAFVDDLGNSYATGLSGLILDQANQNIGDGDLSKFAQVYSICQSYRYTTNQYVLTNRNSNQQNVTFIDMDNITTGGVSNVSNNFTTFGADLRKLGQQINLAFLPVLGFPSSLLIQLIQVGGLLPGVDAALKTQGITTDILSKLQPGVNAGLDLERRIYAAFKTISGSDLDQVKYILDVTTSGLTTMADMLNPIKYLPQSYSSLQILLPAPPGIFLPPEQGWARSSENWSKGQTVEALDRNWGLYRSWYAQNITGWGSNGSFTDVNGIVSVTSTGRNVDIVIVDAPIDPNHPEFALRPDGSGGSRVKYVNWFGYNIPGDPAAGTTYFPFVTTAGPDNNNSNHACHVAGIAAGNTQGWAPEANIYNISPAYITGGAAYNYLYKYILAWHNAKRAAGNTTPTVVNNSWSRQYTIPYTNITTVVYRGTTHSGGPFTINQLANWGITVDSSNNAIIGFISAGNNTDIQDCIDAGIIMVASAMNEDMKITTDPNDTDYNNTLTATGFNSGNPIYYMQGGTPGAASNVILVGSIRAAVSEPGGPDAKSNSSNCGPRVDLYAPGSYITSAWLDSATPSGTGYSPPVPDPRNPSYYIAKYSGTSMAAPQVTGIIACLAALTPSLNQNQARSAVIEAAKVNQIPDTDGGPTDPYSLQGSPNRYLTVPNVLYQTVNIPSVVKTLIYNSGTTINSRIQALFATDSVYKLLASIIPADQALGNSAIARSLQSIINIQNILLPAFADSVSLLQSNNDLALINGQSQAVPASVQRSISSQLATGSGPNGTLTLGDLLGVSTGIPYTSLFNDTANTIDALQTANALYYITDTSKGVFTVMQNALNGDYNDLITPPQVIIPGGLPGAGTYGNLDLAFTDGLLPAATQIISNLVIAEATATANLNSYFTNLAANITFEINNQNLAELDYGNLAGNSKSSVMSLATSLHEIGKDVEPGGPAEFFAVMANTETQTGQAIIASMREGRNIAALETAGLKVATQISTS